MAVDHDEEYALLAAYHTGGAARRAALGRLWALHIGIIHKLCVYHWRFGRHNALDDYKQEAWLALEGAAATYVCGRGTVFISWFIWKLRARLQDYCGEGVVRAPRSDFNHGQLKEKTREKLRRARYAAGMGTLWEMSELDVFALPSQAAAVVDGVDWLHAIEVYIKRVAAYWATRHRPGCGPYGRAAAHDRAVRADRMVAVVMAHYHSHTYREIGDMYGVTKERVRQILKEFRAVAARYNTTEAGKRGYERLVG